MKLQGIKLLAMLLSLTLLLSSCFSYKNLTKEEPITKDFLSKLYMFEFKTDIIQIVEVTSVDAETISGYIYQRGFKSTTKKNYRDTFEGVEKYVAKIYVLEYNPYTTFAVVVIGAFATLVVIAFFSYASL